MAKKKEWVDKSHYRVTSENGRESYLYKASGSLIHPDTCIEKAKHHNDGTTDAYEPDTSILGVFFHGGKGKKKNK